MKKLIRIGMLMWIGLAVCVQPLNVGEDRLLRLSRHSDLIMELRLVNQSMKQLNNEILGLRKETHS